MRAGLKASYNTTITQDTLDAVSMPQWKSMLYALAFMHTIVQERRKFGPLGFNIPYEFSQADLSACVQFIQNHITDVDAKKRPVDWPTVNYMVCDVQYGGKITDSLDRRMFSFYTSKWMTPETLGDAFITASAKLHVAMLTEAAAQQQALIPVANAGQVPGMPLGARGPRHPGAGVRERGLRRLVRGALPFGCSRFGLCALALLIVVAFSPPSGSNRSETALCRAAASGGGPTKAWPSATTAASREAAGAAAAAGEAGWSAVVAIVARG